MEDYILEMQSVKDRLKDMQNDKEVIYHFASRPVQLMYEEEVRLLKKRLRYLQRSIKLYNKDTKKIIKKYESRYGLEMFNLS